MEIDATVATLAAGSLSLFISGWFFGRARSRSASAPETTRPAPETRLESPPGVAPHAALERELEIAREEIRKKDQHIEELRTNTNRLGQRILEVESELHAKEEELREFQAKNSPKELLDSMDPFVDALQKESDQLREELENAYRLINRQELELSRLRSSSVDFQPEEAELQLRLQKAEEELQILRAKCEQYESMLLEAGTPPGASMADSQSFVPPLLRDAPKTDHPETVPSPALRVPADPSPTKPY